MNYYEELNNHYKKIVIKETDYDLNDNRLLRVKKYCNFLDDIEIKDEQFDFEKLNLTFHKVIILIRHGDRGPLKIVKNLDSLLCNNSYFADTVPNKDHFTKLAKDFLNNKENLKNFNISADYLNFPNDKCSIGQLTKFGITQHVKLGHLISSHYASKLKISKKILHKSIKINTTPFPRTYQSAISFLHGFYSNLNESIFHKCPEFTCFYGTHFCGPSDSSEYCQVYCPIIDKLHEKLKVSKLMDKKSYQTLDDMVDNLKRLIAPTLNDSIAFKSVISVFDGLNSYFCHKEKLPCDQDTCVSVSQVRQMLAYIDYLGKQLMDSSDHFLLSWLKIYGFLHQLDFSMAKSNEKIVLFSGHDVTIESLSTALGFYDGNIPPYASRVIFEVFSDINNTQLFRVIYNGKDVTRHLDICKQNKCFTMGQHKLVDSNQFNTFCIEKFRDITKANNYTQACNSYNLTEHVDNDYDNRV